MPNPITLCFLSVCSKLPWLGIIRKKETKIYSHFDRSKVNALILYSRIFQLNNSKNFDFSSTDRPNRS